jgi:hypothetical protein
MFSYISRGLKVTVSTTEINVSDVAQFLKLLFKNTLQNAAASSILLENKV